MENWTNWDGVRTFGCLYRINGISSIIITE